MSRGLYVKSIHTGPAHHSEEQQSAEESMFICRLICECCQSVTEAQNQGKEGASIVEYIAGDESYRRLIR